jgi:signal transduction histidine kinase
MRYTAPGVEPRIEVTAERIGSLVVVTVADNGVGIPATELERIFQPFHRLQGRRADEDSGLGLAICRRIATMLGGRVWAEAEHARGTRLHVALQAVP